MSVPARFNSIPPPCWGEVSGLRLGAFRCLALDWPGFRPGGRPPFLLRQERRQRRRPASPVIRCANDSPALLTPGGRRGTRPAGSDSRAGLPRLPFRCSAGRNGLLPSTEPLLKPWSAFTGKAKPQGLASAGFSAEARCLLKARSDPPSSGVSGGEVRRGCLRRRSRRVPRRPPDASSAGESFAQRTTGEAGSPSLPSFLATQERRSPAGANSRPIQLKTAESRPAKAPRANEAPPTQQSLPTLRQRGFLLIQDAGARRPRTPSLTPASSSPPGWDS